MTSTFPSAATEADEPARLVMALDMPTVVCCLVDYQTAVARLQAELAERDADIADLRHEFARYRCGARHALLIQRHRLDVLLRKRDALRSSMA